MFSSRCPWCGEKVPQVSIYRFWVYHCPNCDNPIKFKTSSIKDILKFPLYQQPYLKISKHYVAEKKARYKIEWDLNLIKNPKFNLTEDVIIRICFINNNRIDLSNITPVSLYIIKSIDKYTFEGILSFVKYGNLDRDYRAGTEFLVFDDESIVGRGNLIEDIHYPSFNI